MIRSNSKKAIENIRNYILVHSDFESYEIENPDNFKETAKLLFDIFHEEKVKHDSRNLSDYALFEEWLSGLPSVFDSLYYYNRSAIEDVRIILEETETEANKYTEAEAEKLLTWLIYREITKVCDH